MVQNQRLVEMNRREAMRALVFGACSTIPVFSGLSPEALLAQAKAVHNHVAQKAVEDTEVKPNFLSPHQRETVAMISDLIIPKTTTPGARDAGVHEFIDVLLASLDPPFRQEFLEGLVWTDRRSNQLFHKAFIEATRDQQTVLLTVISTNDSLEEPIGKEFFKQIKTLTVFGFYTSKEGMEQELGYQGPMHPGVYQGCTHPEHGA